MSKAPATSEFVSFSFADFASSDTADMAVVVNGKITDWVWTFAGPGHPQAVDVANRAARQRLHRERDIEQTRLNGKKVKLPEESVDEVRTRNVDFVLDRMLGWSPVKIDGADYPFSVENARRLLDDRRNISLLTQALEFIADDNSFTKRSVEA